MDDNLTKEDYESANNALRVMGYYIGENDWVFSVGDDVHPVFNSIDEFAKFLKITKKKHNLSL